MKTQDLIGLLAQDPMPAAPPVRQQLSQALLGSALVSGTWLLVFWGLNPDMGTMAIHPAFATKMLWLLALAVFSARGLLHLSRPGMGVGSTFWGLALALLAMGSLGLMQSLEANPDSRMALWMGSSWQTCALSILALALPVLGALLWALRQLAPTRPALAGAAAGAMAGCVAAGFYSLHCTETTFAFFAAWYGGGMLIVSALGALLGSRLLRW
ncbi:NrsF family protein [Limnohabitans radicicola]|uniref:DUF1109 domain-containing protein n=1 Tax=Limnohabitans radicicola TaxID=2771427 RepID=A0A927FFC9_9BURK|nr:DUF1109 domain-containing protein [Limnohabitans radicicola]MBD8050026.1 DUF1109 domain-containing protein [Limnohabitans radicicola]